MEVALAAVKLAHEASSGTSADDEEIPEVAARPERDRDASRGPRDNTGPRGQGRGRPQTGAMARLFVGLGRAAGVRPQDLVGAIANESNLRGREIGAIEISDRFSLVEVPEGSADEVVVALRGTTIKGRKATVRLHRS